MQLFVSGKHIDVSEALRQHVETRLSAGVSKYFDRAIDAQVQFSKARHLYRADISAHVVRGVSLQAHAEADGIYPAFDAAADKIEKRLRRFKRRLNDHHADKPGPEREEELARRVIFAGRRASEAEPDGPLTIAETTPLETLTVGEAVLGLERAERPLLVFRNRAHGRVNVVYRRADGNIGWIDPTE